MIPKALTQQLPTSAWARLPAPQTRRFVSHEVLRLIRRTDLGEASLKAFRFQAPSDCLANSRRIRDALVQNLIEQGLLMGPSPDQENWGQTVRRWFGLPRQTDERGVTSAEQLMRLNQRHGPLVLTLQGALAPGQGDDTYTRHHAVVLIASFSVDSARVGILIDGNDLQHNTAINRIAHWLTSQGQHMHLSQLTLEDLERINSDSTTQPDSAQGEDHVQGTDVLQTAFRLVDLDALVARSEQRYLQKEQFAIADGAHSERPNLLEGDRSLSTSDESIPAEVLTELRQAIRQNPQLVERFEPEL